MTLKDLAAAAGLPASRAHPTGELRPPPGLIEQDAVAGVMRSAGGAAARPRLPAPARSAQGRGAGGEAHCRSRSTRRWRSRCGGNMGLAIVRVIEGSQPLHVNMRAGSVMALLGTATGRAFAAVLPARVVKEMLAGPQGDARRADRTPVKDVARELEAIAAEYRRHGVTRARRPADSRRSTPSAPRPSTMKPAGAGAHRARPRRQLPGRLGSRRWPGGARGRGRGVAPARPPRLKTPQKTKPSRPEVGGRADAAGWAPRERVRGSPGAGTAPSVTPAEQALQS